MFAYNIPNIAYIRGLAAKHPGSESLAAKPTLAELVKKDIEFLTDCIRQDATDGKSQTSTEFMQRTVDHPLYQEFIQKLYEFGYYVKIANSPCGLVEVAWNEDAKLIRYDYKQVQDLSSKPHGWLAMWY